ncbi:MAG TPA: CPBP family intramembrane glutamic endopeptidase [Ktedonobacteraceae bacterium]
MSILPPVVSQAAPKSGVLVALLRRYPLFSYFFIAYLLSWLGWLPLVLSQDGLRLLPFHLPGPPNANVGILGGAFGPIGSGFLCTAIMSGKAGLRQLLRRFILWRVGVQWYVFAILGFPTLLLLGIFVTVPGALAAFRLSMLPLTLLLYVGLLIVGMFISPLAEEPGWRGFALPRLQERYGPFMGSIILGLFWGCWHFPLFLVPGYNGVGTGFLGVGIPFGEFLVGIIAVTILMTWAFNHTRGSLLIALLIHSAIDSFPRPLLFPPNYSDGLASSLTLLGFAALAVVILIVTRGKLGYRGNVSE